MAAGARGARPASSRGHEPYPAVVVDRALGPGRGQPRRAGPARRRAPPHLLEPPRQRAAREPAPRGHGAAHRQPRRVARAPARARSTARSRSPATPALARAARRARGLPGARAPPGRPRPTGDIAVPLRIRSADGRGAARSSAPSRPSAPRSTSPSPSCRSSRSSRPTRPPRRPCATPCLRERGLDARAGAVDLLRRSRLAVGEAAVDAGQRGSVAVLGGADGVVVLLGTARPATP